VRVILSLRPSEAEPQKFDKLILRSPISSQPLSPRRIPCREARSKWRIGPSPSSCHP